jgi:hypothetical protein
MRKQLNKLKHDVATVEEAPLLTRVALVPVLVRDLLGLLENIIDRLEPEGGQGE